MNHSDEYGISKTSNPMQSLKSGTAMGGPTSPLIPAKARNQTLVRRPRRTGFPLPRRFRGNERKRDSRGFTESIV